jgi:hypothetical protein
MLAEDLEIVAVTELVHWRGSVRGKFCGVNLRSCVWRGSRFTSSGLPPSSDFGEIGALPLPRPAATDVCRDFFVFLKLDISHAKVITR